MQITVNHGVYHRAVFGYRCFYVARTFEGVTSNLDAFLQVPEGTRVEAFPVVGERIRAVAAQGDGVSDKAAITAFFTQPLIRYEMNDLIVLDDKCPCGSNFRRIKQVLGRHDDILYFYKGEGKEIQYVFPDLFVRWIIVTSDNIREFKVIQDHINSITVKVDLMDSDIGIEDRLKAKLTSELGRFEIFKPEITIVQETISLPRERNKFKRFESHVEMPGSQV